MDVELRHLRAFVAVAEELNFTRAAQRLFIAQQALSGQIRQLESRLGTPLLLRTTRKVELTPAGRALYPRATKLLADLDELVAAVKEHGGARRKLVVGFVAPVDHPAVAPALAAFEADHPGVALVVRYGDLLDPTGGLRSREADVAFTYGPFDTTDLECRTIFTEPVGVALAADHPLATHDVVALGELLDESTFDFPTPDATWREFWEAGHHRREPPRYAAQFRSLDALVEAIRAGLGVHLATRSLVETTAASAGIVWRPVPDLEPLEHHLTWRADDTRAPVLAFVESVTAALASSRHSAPGEG